MKGLDVMARCYQYFNVWSEVCWLECLGWSPVDWLQWRYVVTCRTYLAQAFEYVWQICPCPELGLHLAACIGGTCIHVEELAVNLAPG
jgi:hypothetical protein